MTKADHSHALARDRRMTQQFRGVGGQARPLPVPLNTLSIHRERNFTPVFFLLFL